LAVGCASLWIEETKQLLFFTFAERSAHTHMAHYGSGYARRETFGRRVATRTVLLKYLLTVVVILRDLLCRNGRSGWWSWRPAAPLRTYSQR
jgi:hypothetical protein